MTEVRQREGKDKGAWLVKWLWQWGNVDSTRGYEQQAMCVCLCLCVCVYLRGKDLIDVATVSYIKTYTEMKWPAMIGRPLEAASLNDLLMRLKQLMHTQTHTHTHTYTHTHTHTHTHTYTNTHKHTHASACLVLRKHPWENTESCDKFSELLRGIAKLG